jgi:hypothetical protein
VQSWFLGVEVSHHAFSFTCSRNACLASPCRKLKNLNVTAGTSVGSLLERLDANGSCERRSQHRSESGALELSSLPLGVHALARSLGMQKASVVGHDIGLMVAYAYAGQFPSLAARGFPSNCSSILARLIRSIANKILLLSPKGQDFLSSLESSPPILLELLDCFRSNGVKQTQELGSIQFGRFAPFPL